MNQLLDRRLILELLLVLLRGVLKAQLLLCSYFDVLNHSFNRRKKGRFYLLGSYHLGCIELRLFVDCYCTAEYPLLLIPMMVLLLGNPRLNMFINKNEDLV